MTLKEAKEKIKSLEAENKLLKLTELDYHTLLKGEYNIRDIDQYLYLLGLTHDAMPFLAAVERLEASLFTFVQHLQYPPKKGKGRNLNDKEAIKKFHQSLDGMSHTQRLNYYIGVLSAKPDKTKPSILEGFVKAHANVKTQKDSAEKVYFLAWCKKKRIDFSDKKHSATKIDLEIFHDDGYKFKDGKDAIRNDGKPSREAITKWLKAIRSK